MRLISATRAYAAAVLALAAFQSSSSSASITVPKGTDVVLAFDQELNSKHARAGDQVKFHVVDNVIVGGKTVIKAGTPETGVITKVEKRKHFGVNARMMIDLQAVRSTNGAMIPLEPKGKGSVIGVKTAEAGAASGGGAVLLGPVGLVGGYFIVGKQVNVKPGDRLATEVAADIVIKN